MQTHNRSQVSPVLSTRYNDDRLVKDITVEQLRTLIQITVEELLIEFLGDPDEGLELKADVQEQLLQKQKLINRSQGLSTTEVLQVLGLD